jgi:hypothetical protein
MLMTLLATILLSLAIVLFGGTIIAYLHAACSGPTRGEEIRRLRRAGLQEHQDET